MIRSRIRARSFGASAAPWYLSTTYKADGVYPSLIADFANNRYAANSSAKNFSDILTLTRGSTATYFDSSGVLRTAAVDTPRLDYDPATGTAPGLLIEEQRVNLAYPNGSYGLGSVITTGQADPMGSTGARLSTANAGGGVHGWEFGNVTPVASTVYTASAFVKAGTIDRIQLAIDYNQAQSSGIGDTRANFYLNGSGSVTAAGGNRYISSGIRACSGGWYRIWVTYTSSAAPIGGTAFDLFGLLTGSEAYDATYTAVGGETFYLYGNQIEAGSFPTSYIPTTTATATRSADYLSNTGSNNVPFSSWYNSAAGTMYADYNCSNDGSTCGVASISDNTTNNRLLMRSLNGQSAGYIVSGGTVVYNNTGFYAEPTNTKQAFAATVNDAIQCSNANLSAADNTVTMPVSPTQLVIGAGETTGTAIFTGWIKEFRYYNQRITNSELQRITT